ncbi:flagellar hook-length control protein FliK [Aliiroseovarius crassostreae]|uniref:flagellar hook-length control protein FliK n=1 Tax=Aliiroseovarius crassostreae TaxID=154981 RepID=UPI0022065882|nr:flagellar hook-length control protein FliK [Aliiroseovarius crassostreae]UWQ04899.1 flagellar hook-length control protein FliK [Aliiroseovarius crassostreae]
MQNGVSDIRHGRGVGDLFSDLMSGAEEVDRSMVQVADQHDGALSEIRLADPMLGHMTDLPAEANVFFGMPGAPGGSEQAGNIVQRVSDDSAGSETQPSQMSSDETVLAAGLDAMEAREVSVAMAQTASRVPARGLQDLGAALSGEGKSDRALGNNLKSVEVAGRVLAGGQMAEIAGEITGPGRASLSRVDPMTAVQFQPQPSLQMDPQVMTASQGKLPVETVKNSEQTNVIGTGGRITPEMMTGSVLIGEAGRVGSQPGGNSPVTPRSAAGIMSGEDAARLPRSEAPDVTVHAPATMKEGPSGAGEAKELGKEQARWASAPEQSHVAAPASANPSGAIPLTAGVAPMQAQLNFLKESSARLPSGNFELDQLFATSSEAGIAEGRMVETLSSRAELSAQMRTELPRHVALQLADVARKMPDRPVELTLSPEELGKLRLTFSGDLSAMTIAVNVERPETLDLMRRHIDLLAQEMRDIGYGEITFSFTQSGAGGKKGGQSFTDHAPSSSGDVTDKGHVPDKAEPVHLNVMTRSGIDIRL